MTVAACRSCGQVIAVAAGSSATCPNCGWSSDAPHATKLSLPDLRDGLALARGANAVSVFLSLGLFGVQVYVVSDPGPDAARYGLPLAIVLGIGLLVTLVGHLAGQFYCATSPASHGGPLAMGSALCTAFAGLLFACAALSGHLNIAVVVAGALFLLAVVLWVLFFCQLAAGLGDRRLSAAAQALVAGCVLSFLMLGVLTARVGAAGLARDHSESLVWQLVVGVGNIVFGIGYHLFLNVAVRAVSARLAQTTGRN